jgi:DNA-binding MarR family transcriptional regulator
VPDDPVQRVRAFNRTVTQRLGALNDEYLARDRPLGASRVLWEIGDEGTDARTIRARLDLDSGYLSRLLRGLEAAKLVRVQPDPSDLRVRVVRLTKAGQTERAELDRLSDQLAWSLLEPLTETQRARAVEAMQTVERLLTAGQVVIAVEDPTSVAAQFCSRAYYADLESRFDDGFDPGASHIADAQDLELPRGLLLLARLRGEPVACGALRLHGRRPAEIKRMWVAPQARGLGLARRLLTELEDQARRRGVPAVRLETNQRLVEAIGLYRTAGYREVDAFNDEPYAHHWFEKDLRSRSGSA